MKTQLALMIAAASSIASYADTVGKDFPKASLEELAAIDSQLADAFEAHAKAPAGRDDPAPAIWLQASEVFRQRAKDEAHIRSAFPTSRDLAAALATGDEIAIRKLNILAQHAPLPRIAALYRNIALAFVDRAEIDNPIGLPPMKFLPPAPDRIISDEP